jgi:hypothetical protein
MYEILNEIFPNKKYVLDEIIKYKGSNWINYQLDSLLINIESLIVYIFELLYIHQNIYHIILKKLYNNYVNSHVLRIYKGKRVPILSNSEITDIVINLYNQI